MVVVWALGAIVLVVAAPSLNSVGVQNEAAFLPASAPSQVAQRAVDRLFPSVPGVDSVVVVLRDRDRLGWADLRLVSGLDKLLTSPTLASRVTTVDSPVATPALASVLISPTRQAELVVATVRAAPFTPPANTDVAQIRRWLARHVPPGTSAAVTGEVGLGADENSALVTSFDRAAIVAGLLVLLVMVAVYRSLVALVVPLSTVAVSLGVAQGLVGLLAAHGLAVSTMAGTFMVVMVFGAGTDYCLFLVSRQRRELAGTVSPAVAAGRTLRSAGRVVAASATIVVLSFSAMVTARFGLYRTMGPALAVAVAVTAAAALSFAPAMMALLGRRISPTPTSSRRGTAAAEPDDGTRDEPRDRSDGHLHGAWDDLHGTWDDLHGAWDDLHGTWDDLHGAWDDLHGASDDLHGPGAEHHDPLSDEPGGHTPAIWRRLGQLVARRPVVPAVLGTVLLAIAATGMLGLHQSFNLVDELPASAGSRVGFDTIAATFGPGALAPLEVVVQSPASYHSPRTLLAIDRLATVIRRQRWVAQVRSLTEPRTHGSATLLQVISRHDPFGSTAQHEVTTLRGVVHQALAGTVLAKSPVAIAGPSAQFADLARYAQGDLWRIVIAVLVVLSVVLTILLGSLVAPLVLAASLLLSVAAALGLTTVLFHDLLGQPHLSFWVPPFLFVMLVALGADYSVLVVTRIRDHVAGAPAMATHQAAAIGLVETAPVVSAAGLVLAGSFLALIAAPLPTLQQVGVAVGVGVLLDTFVVRPLVVPAVIAMLGEATWWRPHLRFAWRRRRSAPRGRLEHCASWVLHLVDELDSR